MATSTAATVRLNREDNRSLASLLDIKNSSQIDVKSSISNSDRCDIIMQTAIDGIESFAAGYDSGGFKATVDSFSNTIKSVQLLS